MPIDFTTAAIIGLSLYTATYVAEAVRSGINTVPVGQAEAARAIGLPFGQALTLVILPQAFRAVIPPMISVLHRPAQEHHGGRGLLGASRPAPSAPTSPSAASPP